MTTDTQLFIIARAALEYIRALPASSAAAPLIAKDALIRIEALLSEQEGENTCSTPS